MRPPYRCSARSFEHPTYRFPAAGHFAVSPVRYSVPDSGAYRDAEPVRPPNRPLAAIV